MLLVLVKETAAQPILIAPLAAQVNKSYKSTENLLNTVLHSIGIAGFPVPKATK